MLSLDTETTGVDFHHGAQPFFVTTCTNAGHQRHWGWRVDPLTRRVQVDQSDLDEIAALIGESLEGGLALQNAKFDFAALRTVGLWGRLDVAAVWAAVHDTLMAGHLIRTNEPHNLTDMAVAWLGIDIQPFEDRLEEAVQECRRYCRTHLPEWRIAKAGLCEMPSAREKTWKYDTWLPYELATELNHPDDHPWYRLLYEYANADSSVTAALIDVQVAEIRRRGLWEIYLERLKVLPIAYQMEGRGITLSAERLEQLVTEYTAESAAAGAVCVNIAAGMGYELELPKNGLNHSLRRFCFGRAAVFCPACQREVEFPVEQLEFMRRCQAEGRPCVECQREGRAEPGRPRVVHVTGLDLPRRHSAKAKTSAPTLDKGAMEWYEYNLEDRSKAKAFVRALKAKRKRDTALAYMESYRRFWLRWSDDAEGWYVLHPNLNPTGTDTLRWSSNNPNEQNISKQEGFNLRYCFGPAPGREWWSLDAKNIELRIPAYESGEQAFIDLFERPDDPPYFGSNHLLVAHLLFPKEFEACVNGDGVVDGRLFKKKYAATLYQRVKNGNFAVQYGAVDREDGMGTADRTYGLPGAQARINARFTKQKQLNDKMVWFANKHGYVETLPDKTVNPRRGFPIMCTRTDYGKIKPTVPLNYHVQGTAMWWTQKAMVRVYEFFEHLNSGGWFAKRRWPGGYYIALQVHDELVPDMPTGAGKGKDPWEYNLPVIRHVQKLMAMGGDDIGVPTPVGVEYHAVHWGEGVTL